MYRVFRTHLDCDFLLPGFPSVEGLEADLSICLSTTAVETQRFRWIHTWADEPDDLPLIVARADPAGSESEYLLRFPGEIDFVVSGSIITCHPHKNCSTATLSHLLLDQVVPRIIAHRGSIVLHASAVALHDGRVVAFCGRSGSGKSTLAAYLRNYGCELLCDDCLLLNPRASDLELVPAYAGIRMSPATIAELGLTDQPWQAVAGYSGKQQQFFESPKVSYPVDTIYLLGDNLESAPVVMAPVAGADALVSLQQATCLLDIHDRGCAARQFSAISDALRHLPNFFTLNYTRQFSALPAVCEQILNGESG